MTELCPFNVLGYVNKQRYATVALSRVEFCKARDPITYYAKS